MQANRSMAHPAEPAGAAIGEMRPWQGPRTLAAGAFASQAVAVAASPLLSRLYTQEEFGTLALYNAALSIGSVVAALRFEAAVLLPESDSVAADLMWVGAASTALVTAGAVALIPASGPAYLGVVPISLACTGLHQMLLYWSLRRRLHLPIAASKLCQTSSTACLQIAGGCLAAGGTGLIAGDALGRLAALVTLGLQVGRQAPPKGNGLRPSRWIATASRYRRFPLLLSWSAILNVAAMQAPVFFLSRMYEPGVVGLYALADRVLAAPGVLVGQSLAQVYMADAARLAGDRPAELQRIFWRYAKNLLLPASLLGAALWLFGPALFAAVFGSGWREAGQLARMLALSQAVSFVVWPLTQTLVVMEMQSLQVCWDLLRVALTVGSLWLCQHLQASPRWSVFAYGGTLAAAYLAHFVLSARAIRRRVERVEASH